MYYLPIYFQSVDDMSPIMSGVANLPLILSFTATTIASGMLITATDGKITLPLKVGGAAIATIAAGLLYTLNINTSTGKWIGYQIFGGIGWGISFQVPIIVSQGAADATDVSTVTALILFIQ